MEPNNRLILLGQMRDLWRTKTVHRKHDVVNLMYCTTSPEVSELLLCSVLGNMLTLTECPDLSGDGPALCEGRGQASVCSRFVTSKHIFKVSKFFLFVRSILTSIFQELVR